MFRELLPLLKGRMLMLTIADVGDGTLRVNVIPQRKESDITESALSSPLSIMGTAEELDREFANQITGFRASLDRLKSNLGEIEAAHATALKAVEEERKKELNSKRKATGASGKPAARTDSETASTATNGKPALGSRAQSAPGATAPSLFDSGPSAAEPAEQPPEFQPESRPEPNAEPHISTTESTVNARTSAASSDQPVSGDTKAAPAECVICHGPILTNQQRHSLMPFPAHASASDCEAARRRATAPAN